MLAFIDEIVIPFLNSLYGAVGYLGVMLAMAIESAMIPLPSELILPYAGFLVSDPTQIEPLTGSPWNFWIVVIVATIGNTLGSLDRLRHRRLRRPAVPRALREVPADPARTRSSSPTGSSSSTATRRSSSAGCCRSSARSSASRPASRGCRSCHFIVYSTAGAFLWSALLVYAGTILGDNWVDIRHAAPAVRPRDRGRGRRAGGRVHLVAARDAGQARATKPDETPTEVE